MEYEEQKQQPKATPRLIIHGGAGNVTPTAVPPERYAAFREALLTIASYTSDPGTLES